MTDHTRSCHEAGCARSQHPHLWDPETCPNDTIPGDDGTRVYRDQWNESATRELPPDDLEALRSRTNAYYFSFEPTGVQVIDDILHALAWAGKAYHHTEGWPDNLDFDYGPLRKGEDFIALIQSLANDGADEIRKGLLR